MHVISDNDTINIWEKAWEPQAAMAPQYMQNGLTILFTILVFHRTGQWHLGESVEPYHTGADSSMGLETQKSISKESTEEEVFVKK